MPGLKKRRKRDFLVVKWLRIHFPVLALSVLSLGRELTSHVMGQLNYRHN